MSDRPTRTQIPHPARRPLGSLVLAAALAVGVSWAVPAPAGAQGYPEPRLAPTSWEFDFEWRQPRRIVLEEPDGARRAYWYITYTVTNNTEQERTFLPEIVMLTREGEPVPANDNIPMGVFEAVKSRTPSLPLVASQEVSGRLLIGEDRARSSVAIWREPHLQMGAFHIFIGGLSGEVVRLTDRQGNELAGDDGNPLLIRKTKQLTFRVRGEDVDTSRDDAVAFEGQRWIMR